MREKFCVEIPFHGQNINSAGSVDYSIQLVRYMMGPVCVGLLHVWVGESAHERVWTHHLLGANAGGELSVAITKLVHIDGDYVCVVVEFDEPL